MAAEALLQIPDLPADLKLRAEEEASRIMPRTSTSALDDSTVGTSGETAMNAPRRIGGAMGCILTVIYIMAGFTIWHLWTNNEVLSGCVLFSAISVWLTAQVIKRKFTIPIEDGRTVDEQQSESYCRWVKLNFYAVLLTIILCVIGWIV